MLFSKKSYLLYDNSPENHQAIQEKTFSHILCQGYCSVQDIKDLFLTLSETGANENLILSFLHDSPYMLKIIELLADYLKSGNSPKGFTLRLDRHNLTLPAIAILKNALQSGRCNEGLTLDLSDNDIGNEGLLALILALESGNCPENLTINLQNNSITQFGWSEYGINLEKFPKGFKLDLRNNAGENCVLPEKEYSQTRQIVDPIERKIARQNHIEESTAVALRDYLRKARPEAMTLLLCNSISQQLQNEISTLLEFSTSFNKMHYPKLVGEQLFLLPVVIKEIILTYLLVPSSINHNSAFYLTLCMSLGDLLNPSELAHLSQLEALQFIHDVCVPPKTSGYNTPLNFFVPENKMELMGSQKTYWKNVFILKIKNEFLGIKTLRIDDNRNILQIEFDSNEAAIQFQNKLDKETIFMKGLSGGPKSDRVVTTIQGQHLTITDKYLPIFVHRYGIGSKNIFLIDYKPEPEGRSCALM